MIRRDGRRTTPVLRECIQPSVTRAAIDSQTLRPEGDGAELREESSAVPQPPLPENKLYYPSLDGLRAFAALLVFCQHYVLSTHADKYHWGWVGVDIFFVLSGFLITGILYDTRNDRHRFRNFYVRRSLRIFPLYYAVIAVVLLLTPWMQWAWSRHWLLWPLYVGNYSHALHPGVAAEKLGSLEFLVSRRWGFALSFGHFWSLCVEEQFYLVWPLMVFLIRRRELLRNICVAVVVAVPLLRLAGYFLLPRQWVQGEILYFATPFRVDALLLGAWLALVLRGPNAARVRSAGRAVLGWGVVALGVAWCVAARGLHQGFSAEPDTPWINTLGFSLVDVCALGLLLLALRPGSVVYRAFSYRPLRRLGQISYGFYIFHDLLHQLYQRVAQHVASASATRVELVTGVIAFCGTIVVAMTSYRVLELPFLRLKDRFTITEPLATSRDPVVEAYRHGEPATQVVAVSSRSAQAE